jgi:hypothetical protein
MLGTMLRDAVPEVEIRDREWRRRLVVLDLGHPMLTPPMMRAMHLEWPQGSRRGGDMPRYVIEREIPGAGKLTPVELKGISQKSCAVLGEMGPKIQWVQSYVVDDKVYCVYIAPDEATVRTHAQMGGFPANRVSEVRAIIDPITSE